MIKVISKPQARELVSHIRSLFSNSSIDHIFKSADLLVDAFSLLLPDLNNKQLRIASYFKMDSEISTTSLNQFLLNQGCLLYFPKITDFQSNAMEMILLEDLTQTSVNKWGIEEPLSSNLLSSFNLTSSNSVYPQLDYIIMPSVAIDSELNRLGHGKGFYDRYLANYFSSNFTTQTKLPILIGIIDQKYFLQSYKFIIEVHDIPLDYLIVVDTLSLQYKIYIKSSNSTFPN